MPRSRALAVRTEATEAVLGRLEFLSDCEDQLAFTGIVLMWRKERDVRVHRVERLHHELLVRTRIGRRTATRPAVADVTVRATLGDGLLGSTSR